MSNKLLTQSELAEELRKSGLFDKIRAILADEAKKQRRVEPISSQ